MHRSLDKHGEIPSNKLGSHDHLELDQPLFLYPHFIGLWGTYRPQVYFGIRARYYSACLFNFKTPILILDSVCYSTTVLTF